MMLRLVGLAGPAQCGKSSFSRFVREELSLKEYSLAGPIKDLMCALFGWDERHREGELKEAVVEAWAKKEDFIQKWNELRMSELLNTEMNLDEFSFMLGIIFQDDTANEGPFISPRRAYQLFGTEYARGINHNVWLDMAKRALDESPENEGLIIPDIRFPNEHQWVSQNGGVVVHIRRAGSKERIKETKHESEAGLKHMAMDWVIPECRNLDELKVQAKKFAQFAKFATTTDVAVSPKMPTFNDMYGELNYGG